MSHIQDHVTEYRTRGDIKSYQSVVSECANGVLAGGRKLFASDLDDRLTVPYANQVPTLKALGKSSFSWIRGISLQDVTVPSERNEVMANLLAEWVNDADNELIYVELYEDDQAFSTVFEHAGFVRQPAMEDNSDILSYLYIAKPKDVG